MSKLTKREQSLILVLLFILVVGVGVTMVLLPLNDEVTAMRAQKDLLMQQEVDMRNKILSISKVRENKGKLIAEVDAMLAELSDPLMEENFDILTQELASNRSVKISSLSYGGIEAAAPSAVGTPSRRYEYNLMNMIDVYRNYAPEPSKALTTDHQILKQSITLTLNGSYNNLRSFISDINHTSQTIFVHGVTYANNISLNVDDLGLEHEKKVETATLSLDIYFIEKVHTGIGSNYK
jgi:Tfp pilus assembly protein PilO